MQENHEMTDLNEHLANAEIMRAIRYLDPDLCAETTGEDIGTVVGIGITLLSALTDALTYISLYVRDL
jgi:hypothetical protein